MQKLISISALFTEDRRSGKKKSQSMKRRSTSTPSSPRLISTWEWLTREEAEYQKTLQIYPNYVEAHTNLGIIFFRQGLLDQSLAEYQKAVEIKPEYAKGYYNIGSVYRQKKNLDEAITSFQKALEINPKYAEAHYALAVIYYEKEEFKSAIEHIDQAGKLGMVLDPKLLERLKSYR